MSHHQTWLLELRRRPSKARPPADANDYTREHTHIAPATTLQPPQPQHVLKHTRSSVKVSTFMRGQLAHTHVLLHTVFLNQMHIICFVERIFGSKREDVLEKHHFNIAVTQVQKNSI